MSGHMPCGRLRAPSHQKAVARRRALAQLAGVVGSMLLFCGLELVNAASGGASNIGAVYAWGQGDIGNGTSTGATTPASENWSGTFVDAESNSSGAGGVALKSDGTVWTWGADNLGQLGNGTVNVSTLTPIQPVVG